VQLTYSIIKHYTWTPTIHPAADDAVGAAGTAPRPKFGGKEIDTWGRGKDEGREQTQ